MRKHEKKVWKDIKYLWTFLLLCCSTIVFAQESISISGTIVDNHGDPLPGVSINVKGATLGDISNADGKYNITVSNKEAVLVFSYMGFATQEITVGNKTSINITMVEDVKQMEEVVVIGFGTQKKVNLTGAVGIATAKDIESRPVTVAAQALQGLVPGLNISQNNGMLDSRPSIKIRGNGTIDDQVNGTPLVLIDGIESDINALNPADIESISILKDAAASSIYGSKAPFGVILITTKKGKSGKTIVNYNNSLRWNSPILLPEFPNSIDFAAYFNDGCMNVPGWGPHFNDNWMQGLKDYQNGVTNVAATVFANNRSRYDDGFDPRCYYPVTGATNVGGLDNRDYYKELFRKSAFAHEHNLSLNGGNDKVTFYASLGLLDQNGLMVFNQDTYKRYTATGKVNYKVSDWVTLNYNHRFVRDSYIRPALMTDDLFKTIGRQCWPMLPMYDGNGNLFEWRAVELRDGGNDNATTDNSYEQLQITIEPVKNWKTFVDGSYSIKNYNRHWDNFPLYHYDVDNNPYVYNSTTGNVHEEYTKENLFGLNIYSEYAFTLQQKHNFKAMIGFQEQQMSQLLFGLQRVGVITTSLPEVDLTNGLNYDGTVGIPSVNGSRNRWSNMGGFGRLNYDYEGKYLLEVNLRYDASSRFREDHRTVWSPSFSAGWNIANESFFEPLNEVINVLKIRGSYGKLANMNTKDWYPTYSNLGLYASEGVWLQGGQKPNLATPPTTVENPFMTWEKIKSVNAGLDFGLFKNRLTGSFDYYVRTTSDMLGPAPQLPAVLGVDPKRANDTKLQDYGFELSIGWRDRLKNGLGYSARVLLWDYQTKVLKYPSNKTGTITNYYDGKMVGEIWGYTTIGIAKTQEEMDAHLAAVGGQSAIYSSWQAGDIMYANIDGVPGISPGGRTLSDHGDMSVIGNNTPRYQFGIDLNADWKGFDIRLFFQGVGKRDYWAGNYFFWGATSGGNVDESQVTGNNVTDGGMWNSTCLTPHLDYFRDADTWSVQNGYMSENLDSYYPRIYFDSDNGKNRRVQTRYLQDASYIRLKNLQVGYTLPQSLTQKIKIDQLRIFFSGENLWTATSMMKMFDPETIDGGWNGSVYPLSKILSFGVNINF